MRSCGYTTCEDRAWGSADLAGYGIARRVVPIAGGKALLSQGANLCTLLFGTKPGDPLIFAAMPRLPGAARFARRPNGGFAGL